MSMVTVYAAGLLILFAAFLAWFSRIRLTKKIRELLGFLSDVHGDLSGSAEQVASVAEEIAYSSQEQIDTLSSTVSASHEIRSMIEKTSESSAELKKQASELQDLTRAGNKAVSEMVSSSQEVKSSMAHFNTEMQLSMAQLAEALSIIKEIAGKTEIINTIVFQTKLLSFNASVEAARAGEAGKGFAVVAEEVGNLARLSGTAAGEISAIVEKSVQVANTAIENTRGKIEALTQITAQKSDVGYSNSKACEETFVQMTRKIDETNKMIEHINQAALEQSQGVSQLDSSIQKFQEAADRNRLVASQGTEHAHEFKGQTDSMSKLLSQGWQISGAAKGTRRKLKKFEWNKRLELGTPEMDREHMILVEKINLLVDALEQQYVKEDVRLLKTAFKNLAEYTTQHFNDEEKFLASFGYPQLASHQKIHHHLLNQVAEFGRDIDNGELEDTKLVSFLRNWLLSHIMGVDMKYAEYYRSGAARSAA